MVNSFQVRAGGGTARRRQARLWTARAACRYKRERKGFLPLRAAFAIDAAIRAAFDFVEASERAEGAFQSPSMLEDKSPARASAFKRPVKLLNRFERTA